jgi:hypothetical protein
LCAMLSPVSYTTSGHLACCDACQPDCDRGCHRLKTKYEIGTTPEGLTTVTTGPTATSGGVALEPLDEGFGKRITRYA